MNWEHTAVDNRFLLWAHIFSTACLLFDVGAHVKTMFGTRRVVFNMGSDVKRSLCVPLFLSVLLGVAQALKEGYQQMSGVWCYKWLHSDL